MYLVSAWLTWRLWFPRSFVNIWTISFAFSWLSHMKPESSAYPKCADIDALFISVVMIVCPVVLSVWCFCPNFTVHFSEIFVQKQANNLGDSPSYCGIRLLMLNGFPTVLQIFAQKVVWLSCFTLVVLP